MPSAFDAIPDLSRDTTALFLDFDGTLAPIVCHPDKVQVDRNVVLSLNTLLSALGGALAIISGREIKILDRLLTPHVFPISGAHGFEMRTSENNLCHGEAEVDALAYAEAQLRDLATRHDGLFLEPKSGSVALHFRARPDLEDVCEHRLTEVLQDQPGLSAIHGKMVIEVKAHHGDKGQAIRTFLESPPFANRTPVFLGDDLTDEAGFAAVNDLDGISIKVGTGDTLAAYRLRDVADVADWLHELIAHLQSIGKTGETET